MIIRSCVGANGRKHGKVLIERKECPACKAEIKKSIYYKEMLYWRALALYYGDVIHYVYDRHRTCDPAKKNKDIMDAILNLNKSETRWKMTQFRWNSKVHVKRNRGRLHIKGD